MPELTDEQIARRRKNAAAHLAAGGLMVGGAAAAQEHIARKTGVKGNLAAVKEVAQGRKVLPKHAKFGAGWLGTRGVAAAGVPLAAMGAKNLLAPKPKHTGNLDLRSDVLHESVDRSTPGLPNINQKKLSRKAKAAELGTVTVGSGLGGAAGAALGRRVKGRMRLAAIGAGTAAGAAGGAIGAAPVARKVVRRSTGGEYDYSTERGVYRRGGIKKAYFVEVSKLDANDAAINTLARREQKELIQRKKKQSKFSLASAGLGASALALKAPALAGVASRRLPKVKPLARFAAKAPQADKLATNVGIGSLGVGALGSLNFARIQRAETKADQRSANALKVKKNLNREGKRRRVWDEAKRTGDWKDLSDTEANLMLHAALHQEKVAANRVKMAKTKQRNVDVAKALVPLKAFRPRPAGFGGVRAGGIRRTPSGRLVPYRGSLG